MKQYKLKKEQGFTIIEILIVLAIAGLIMLVVFLAVPALQRNSRNTQTRNDVSVYLGAVSEWSSNNNGRVPSAAADLTTAGSGVNALANTSPATTKPTAVVTGARTNAANPVALNTLEYVANAKCSTTTGETTAASGRSYAVRFAVEGSSGNAVPQCQEG